MALHEKTKVKINLVTFLLLSFFLVYAMATQVLSVLQGRFTVAAFFPDSGGVFSNQEVTYRGVTVGRVGDMSVVPEGVRIELEIEEGTEVPAEDLEVRVMFKSAVGEQFIDLLPGSTGAPFLGDGDEVPLAQTSIPVSTQELLATLEAVLQGVPPEDLKGAIEALGGGLTGRGRDLATIFEATADLADLFAETSPNTQSILRNGTRVGDAFLKSQADFKTAIRQLVVVSESLSGSTGDLERLLRGTNLSSDVIVALLRENRPELKKVIKELAEINKLQADQKGDLNAIFRDLPTALADINKAFESDTGLVRFGLVQDDVNAACSYETGRRAPSDRGKGLPPKKARCQANSQAASRSASSGGISSLGDLATLFGRGAAAASGIPAEPVLPARMANWSWSLFLLNSI